MEESRSTGKPFVISKRAVWEAYERVKANKGAPGVDGCTVEEFEKDLKNNLYKIWNRLSSGTYFPPPVKGVEIPRSHGGGVRLLGVPTVADRIAQTVVAGHPEKRVEPVFHPDSFGYRPGRSALDAVGVCRRRCWDKDWVIDLDVSKFFDSVRWDLVVKAVEAHTGAAWVVLYVKRWLAAPLQLPDGTCGSETGAPRRGLRFRLCWRICSCTMRSTSGSPAIFGTSSSNATLMTRLSTAAPSVVPVKSCGRSGTGWRRLGCNRTRARPGSCTAEETDAATISWRRRSPSSASCSSAAQHGTGTVRFSPRSCLRSARTPSRR